MSVEKKQLQLTYYVRSYLDKIKKENINQLKSVFCYFAIWGSCPGLSNARLLEKSFFGYINFFFTTIKGILAISKQSNFITVNNNNKKKFSKLMVTWAYRKNFLLNGSLHDMFFNTNSRSLKKTLWFVIYMDDEIPKILDKNIVLFKKKRVFFQYNLFYLFKIILFNFVENKCSLKKVFHSLSSNITLSDLIVDNIKNQTEISKLNKIIVPYEAQPFQRYLFSYAKKINKNIRTVGYVHDMMALPINYAPLKGLPDVLLLHSFYQKKYLTNYLKWPEKRTKLIPSMRFLKNKKKMNGKIFLPYTIVYPKRVISEFESFLKSSKKISIEKLEINIHPTSENFKTQLSLKSKLENIMVDYKDRFKKNMKNRKLAVVIGLTSSVIEILENNVEVIHICPEPLFECYNELFWPSIKMKQLSQYTYVYKLIKHGKCLKFGNRENMLKKYC